MTGPAFQDARVAAVFDGYPPALRARLLTLRTLIFDCATATDGVGHLVETLKWGQPAYLTERPRSGTTIRIDAVKGRPDAYAVYFHCGTTLVDACRSRYPDLFEFQGNRALVLSADAEPPTDALRHCIGLALTYHARRGGARKAG
jgi:hypothetical protein